MNTRRRRQFRSAAEAGLLTLILGLLLLAAVCWEPGTASANEHTEAPAEEERLLRDFGLLPAPPVQQEPVRIVYTGAPVAVTLGAGVERRLVFEQPFRLGLDPSIAESFQFEIYDRQLLLRVSRPLQTRAKIQLADGRIIPLDIEGVLSAGITAPLEIIARTEAGTGSTEEPELAALPLAGTARQPGYVDLVRFAAQRMYAPPRLFTDWPGIVASPVQQEPVRLIRGARILATPLASWQSGRLAVTAVRLDNQERRRIALDPRQVVGVWKAAAFQHRSLAEGGSSALYLVSDGPFAEALGIHAQIKVSKMPAGLESWGEP